MNKYLLISLLLGAVSELSGQKAWITPTQINPDDTVTIWVDLSMCDCKRLQGSSGPLYFYTWLPALVSDTSRFFNGEWENSNENLKMTRLNGNVWYYKMVPTRFYGISAVTVYEKDFAFRVKKKDGTGIGGSGCDQDATESLTIAVSPPPAVKNRIYAFPKARTGDSLSINSSDMLTVWYDNRLENQDSLKGKSDFYVYLEARGSNGAEYRVSPYGTHGNNPRLAMKRQAEGLFRLGFIPAEMFSGIMPSGVKPVSIRVQVTRKTIRSGADVVGEIHHWQLNSACD